MKKVCFLLLTGLSLAAVSFTNPPNTLLGRWQWKLPNGLPALLVIRADGTIDMFINGKAYATSKYYVRQDTVGFAGPGCNINYYGTYKFSFPAQDSLRLTVLSDTCSGRSEAMGRLTLGRVPKP